MNPTKLSYCKLHDIIFVPGVGQVGPTLETQQTGIAPAYGLNLNGSFLEIRTSNKQTKAPIFILVPITNVSHMVPVEPSIQA
jgi:hypothetical protein